MKFWKIASWQELVTYDVWSHIEVPLYVNSILIWSRLESKFDIFLVIFLLYRRKLKKESHRAIMESNPHLSIYRRERVETFTVILWQYYRSAIEAQAVTRVDNAALSRKTSREQADLVRNTGNRSLDLQRQSC